MSFSATKNIFAAANVCPSLHNWNCFVQHGSMPWDGEHYLASLGSKAPMIICSDLQVQANGECQDEHRDGALNYSWFRGPEHEVHAGSLLSLKHHSNRCYAPFPSYHMPILLWHLLVQALWATAENVALVACEAVPFVTVLKQGSFLFPLFMSV